MPDESAPDPEVDTRVNDETAETILISRNYSDTALNLTPAFHAQMRHLQPTSAIFNLVSTIMGGGVLSLPFAIEKTGIVLGMVLIVLSAVISDFSVYILVAAARRTGKESYEDLAEHVAGRKGKLLVIVLVFSLTWLCCIAYMILAGKLILRTVKFFMPALDMTVAAYKSRSIGGGVLLVLPLCFNDKLHALRYTSFVSIFSVVLLTVAIVTQSINKGAGFHGGEIKWFPGSGMDGFQEVLYALPLFFIAYLCHFNVLPMHRELRQPTRNRMKKVIHYTMGIPAVLYLFTGVFGYLYQLNGTCDVVLDEFDYKDVFIAVGTIGLATTILFSFPLLVLPCRDSLNRIIVMARVFWALRRFPGKEQDAADVSAMDAEASSDYQRLDDHVEDYHIVPGLEDDPTVSRREQYASELELRYKVQLINSRTHRVLSTLCLVGSALYIACTLTSIMVVWSVMGSTVSLLIAFILPSWFYLSVRWEKPITDRNKLCAMLLLVCSSTFAVVCTMQAVSHLSDSHTECVVPPPV